MGDNELNDKQGCNEDLDVRFYNVCVPWWIRDCDLLVRDYGDWIIIPELYPLILQNFSLTFILLKIFLLFLESHTHSNTG